MANMKLKSIENIQAGDILIKNNMFSSSIHCYYYSVLQISMHILCNFHGLDYEKQNEDSKRIDSHNYTIESTASYLERKNLFYKVDYNKYIKRLKMLRKRADYSEILIVQRDISEAQKAIKFLNELFQKSYNL